MSVHFIAVSAAVWKRHTVTKGQTITLKCPGVDAHQNNVEWKNPDGFIMFFNKNKGDKEISHASVAPMYKQQRKLSLVEFYIRGNEHFGFFPLYCLQLYMTSATASPNCPGLNSTSEFPT